MSVRVFPAETRTGVSGLTCPPLRSPPCEWTASTVTALDRGRQRKEEFVLFPPHYLSSLHLTTSRPIFSCPWTAVCTIRSPGSQTFGLRLSHTTDSTGLQRAESRYHLLRGLLSLHKPRATQKHLITVSYSSYSLAFISSRRDPAPGRPCG